MQAMPLVRELVKKSARPSATTARTVHRSATPTTTDSVRRSNWPLTELWCTKRQACACRVLILAVIDCSSASRSWPGISVGTPFVGAPTATLNLSATALCVGIALWSIRQRLTVHSAASVWLAKPC
uniref:Secreted protein n=1 Tax=Macrostomum lignano TaxID=282301 RepID=A0A1I8H4Z6_9PLAT